MTAFGQLEYVYFVSMTKHRISVNRWIVFNWNRMTAGSVRQSIEFQLIVG